jgi:glycosyl transferase family 87
MDSRLTATLEGNAPGAKGRGGRMVAFGLLGALLALHAMLFYYNWRFAREGYSDFTIFYTAGRIVRLGLANHLYDSELQYQVQRQIAPEVRIRNGPLPYNHPAFEALLFVPFTWLSYPSAFVAWDFGNLFILASLPYILRRCVPLVGRAPPAVWVLVTLAFSPTLAALMQGQDAIMVLLLYALAFAALKRNSDVLAGCWLGLGTFRFHLIIPFVVILFFWKRTKAVQAFLVTTAALALISLWVTGWPEALRYPHYVFHLERIGAGGGIFPVVMPNLRGLIQGWWFAQEFPLAVQSTIIALSLGLLVWVIVSLRRQPDPNRLFDLQFSLALTATVVVSYHTYNYDLVVLAIPALLLANYLTDSAGLEWKSKWTLWLPGALLFCTPLFMLLGDRMQHQNLFAVVLLVWLFGIRREMLLKCRQTEI